MRPIAYLFCYFFFISCLSVGCQPAKEAERHILDARQLLLVKTPHWDAVEGTLSLYEWRETRWEKQKDDIPVNVGKNGMYWGKGLENYGNRQADRAKKEGDGRSPAGIFSLVTAFGYAAPDSLPGLRYPYVYVDAYTQCIEDQASTHYNQITNSQQISPDWQSTDHMLRKDDLYEWGVFVGHNQGAATRPGDGSCIFLHAWREKGKGTAGCTAMAKSDIKDIVFWLDAEKKPLLIQLPEQEYEKFSKAFVLP